MWLASGKFLPKCAAGTAGLAHDGPMPHGLSAHGPPGRVVRVLRRLLVGMSRNPLARRWDRIEAVLVLVLIAVATLALPIAVAAASSTFADQMAMSAEQAASRQQVTATLSQGSRAMSPIGGDPSQTTTTANASWTSLDGVARTGVITVPTGTLSGSTTQIWIDGSGSQTSAPLTSADATATAVLAGVFTELGALVSLTGLYVSGRLLLDRRRTRHWDTEWARFTVSETRGT
jgi:hypothetical protein